MNKQYTALAQSAKENSGGLIEGFNAIQNKYGYVPREAMSSLSEVFDMSESQVLEAASFYSYLSLEPTGKNIIRMCRSAPCHVAGAQQVVDAMETLLNAKMGETTADGLFTLQYTECVGQCGNAPCITINKTAYTDVSAQKLPAILAPYQEGGSK